MESITLGGGCFWCLEAVYDEVKGVHSVESGYMGGHVDNPTYEEVCNKTTGHIEVVRIAYDPAIVSTRDILEIFFAIHDPTSLDQQGNDVGPQYRSAIFYHTEEQRQIAGEAMRTFAPMFEDPIVTELRMEQQFYIAERYHQEYFARNPYQPYCLFIVSPKVGKFRKKFAALKK
jgi:peptide-methionine (S)-S-oxide reductase